MTDDLADRRAAAIEGTRELAELMAQPYRAPEEPVKRYRPPTPTSLRVLPDLVQGTDEWHDQRRGMVTASVVGKLITARSMTASEYTCPDCGAAPSDPCLSKVKRAGVSGAPIKQVHPERTALAVEKRDESPLIIELATGDEAQGLTALLAAERITGHTDPTYVNDDMLRGIDDEPRAVDAYSEHFAPVITVGFMVRSWGRCQLGCSPDGLVGDDGLIEVKSRRSKKQVQTVLSGEVPAENMAQCQAGLFVSGRQWLDYVSYSGGMHLWTVRVTPDPRWFDAITAAVEAFEDAAAEMVVAYHAAVEGLRLTERPVTEMVI